jgi:hypothetical protein
MLDQLRHKRKIRTKLKLQHHSKGQKSLVQELYRLRRFREIPQRFRELALKLNLREILRRFRGVEVQHHKSP